MPSSTARLAVAYPPSLSDADDALKAPSSLVSRNITISGHRTSVRLEPDMWTALREICRREYMTVHALCSVIAGRKPANTSLTAAIRVFVMAYFRAASTEDGHSKAGHGPGGPFMVGLSDGILSSPVVAPRSYMGQPLRQGW